MIHGQSSAQRTLFARNSRLDSLLETFIVAGIVSILVIRFYLAATGYPQIGGGGLHIAHMLWGGLFMLVAIVLLLAFQGRRIQYIAAFLGGVGFGTFIDELGKFITSDNNYFFQPTIALIYVIFVLLFLIFRTIERRSRFSEQEILVNVLDIIKEGVLRNMRPEYKSEALLLLRSADVHDSRVGLLTDIVERMEVLPPQRPNVLDRIANACKNLYQRLVQSPLFAKIVVVFFIGYAIFFILLVLVLVGTSVFAWDHLTISALNIIDFCVALFSIIAGVMIVTGMFQLLVRRARLEAYIWFKRGVLISLLFVQVFTFYAEQLSGLGELLVNLIVLATLNYMIYSEKNQSRTTLMQTYNHVPVGQ